MEIIQLMCPSLSIRFLSIALPASSPAWISPSRIFCAPPPPVLKMASMCWTFQMENVYRCTYGVASEECRCGFHRELVELINLTQSVDVEVFICPIRTCRGCFSCELKQLNWTCRIFTLVLGVQFSTILHLLQIIEQKAPALSARRLGDGEP